MKYLLLCLFLTTPVLASQLEAKREQLYENFQQAIVSGSPLEGMLLTKESEDIYVDALWDLMERGEGGLDLKLTLDNIKIQQLSIREKLRLSLIKFRQQETQLDYSIKLEAINHLLSPEVDNSLLALIAVHQEEIKSLGGDQLIQLATLHPQYQNYQVFQADPVASSDAVTDLYREQRSLLNFRGGRYKNALRLFMFCRQDRSYPCAMVLKTAQGTPVRDKQGSLWVHPSLGASALNLPSSMRNGDTPSGVYTIDGVMPAANYPLYYGAHRRLIMNFIPATKDEMSLKSLLPMSSHVENWWKASIVGRDIGRTDLRIHGTGEVNYDPMTPWYPYIRTAGCVAQLEGTYNGITYDHQRILLDTMMRASGLIPSYQNEAQLKAIFYVVNIDDKKAPVTAEDLKELGIF